MTRFIVSAVIGIALLVLIVLNLNYKSTINLFGARLQDVSVVVIAIAGFVLAILYSFVLYTLNTINRLKKRGRKRARQILAHTEPELKELTDPESLSDRGRESAVKAGHPL